MQACRTCVLTLLSGRRGTTSARWGRQATWIQRRRLSSLSTTFRTTRSRRQSWSTWHAAAASCLPLFSADITLTADCRSLFVVATTAVDTRPPAGACHRRSGRWQTTVSGTGVTCDTLPFAASTLRVSSQLSSGHDSRLFTVSMATPPRQWPSEPRRSNAHSMHSHISNPACHTLCTLAAARNRPVRAAHRLVQTACCTAHTHTHVSPLRCPFACCLSRFPLTLATHAILPFLLPSPCPCSDCAPKAAPTSTTRCTSGDWTTATTRWACTLPT